jgi:fatty acid desaturase
MKKRSLAISQVFPGRWSVTRATGFLTVELGIPLHLCLHQQINVRRWFNIVAQNLRVVLLLLRSR